MSYDSFRRLQLEPNLLSRDFVFYPTAIYLLLEKEGLIFNGKECLVLYVKVKDGAVLIKKAEVEKIQFLSIFWL